MAQPLTSNLPMESQNIPFCIQPHSIRRKVKYFNVNAMHSSPPLQTPTYFLMTNISKSTLLNLKIETWKFRKLQKTIKIPKIDKGGKWPLKTLLFTKRKRTRA